MNIERFISEHVGSPSGAFTSSSDPSSTDLPREVCEAANLGWRIFPVSLFAKLTGNPDLLIGEASCNLSRLKELATAYSLYEWRVAIGPSSLCVLKINGPEGRNSVVALSRDQEECVALRSGRGDTIWAFFRWPANLVLRRSASKLPHGVRVIPAVPAKPRLKPVECAWRWPSRVWLQVRAF